MKEINIARTIMNKRREKGLTQDDIASYIGVSKASVSKWGNDILKQQESGRDL